jgi:hypothetical protein
MGGKISKLKTKCLQLTICAKLVKGHAKKLFLEGIRKVVNRWTRRVAKQGNYVEN